MRMKLLFLILFVLGITALHYLTASKETYSHDVFRRLYYIPIVLGGLWFYLRGGVVTALVISILYVPHIIFQWDSPLGIQLEQYLEILLYNIIGNLTGFLASKEKAQKVLYREAAHRLEESYSKLKEQAITILEVEEQMRRSAQLSALGELSAGLTHEIKNPLSAIEMATEMIQERIGSASESYPLTEILMKEVGRLRKMSEEYLSLAKPTSLDYENLEVNETIQDILQLTRPQTTKNKVKVLFDGGDIAPLRANMGQLKQVFLNLILNAIQAMPEGGTLSISTRQDENNIQISLVDTGKGIPQKDLDNIFRPFFTTRQEGSGLGLAITCRIVEGHKGRIEVFSREKEGTTFNIFLPFSEG